MDSEMERIDARLVDAGRRIGELLAADLETFFVETVRERFVGAAEAEPSDEALRRLKQRTLAGAADAARHLRDRLAPASVWTGAAVQPGEPPITAHPVVAEAVAEVERRLAELLGELEADGLPAGDPVAYRLPARFIGGENLQVLTRSYWRALAQRHGVRGEAERRQAASTAEARRRRWEEG